MIAASVEQLTWDDWLSLPVYGLPQAEKRTVFNKALHELSLHHAEHCQPYQQFLSLLHPQYLETIRDSDNSSFSLPPALTARQFKYQKLSSIRSENEVKVMTSSGTSSQQVSQITLDSITAKRQQQVLGAIMREWLGAKRRPMLILDHPKVIRRGEGFSARGAGIQGFMLFGRQYCYALNEDMSLNIPAIQAFCEQHKNTDVLMFGFTYMAWQFVMQPLLANHNLRAKIATLRGTLIHGGGWKKLTHLAVSTQCFNDTVKQCFGDVSAHNYYGMVEQTGSIHVACEYGHLHAPVWAEVDVLHPQLNCYQPQGEQGVIQVSSVLPLSYPGHVILTEDLGTILGEDDCPCGRKGRYFSVHGRIAKSEVRGCSDTFSPDSHSENAFNAPQSTMISPQAS